MKVVIAFSLLLELFSFLIFDLAKNHAGTNLKLLIRLLSASVGLVLISLDLLLVRPGSSDSILSDMLVVTAILSMYPCSFEKPALAFRISVILALAGFAMALSRIILSPGHDSFRTQGSVSTMSLVLIVFAVYYVIVSIRRFKGLRLFFRNAAVWYGIEDYSRFLYSMAFLSVCILTMCSVTVPGDAGIILDLVCGGVQAVLYMLLYLRAMTGRTFILDEDTETRIKDIIKGNLRTSYIDKAEEDRMMNNLYRKVMLYMSEDKPYLDPSFCMSDLATKVYSNKLYLSRTINILSGRNFRQFVNYHRVQYAIALFKKDPKLKVGEAAEMSGFNSGVSFNMAFKVNTGKTPSEWLREYVMEMRERL